MKRIFTIVTLLVLVTATAVSENWKKIDTEVLADEAWYEFVLDRPNYTYTKITDLDVKEVLTVSPWIENQVVKETFIDIDSTEFKNAIAREAGYVSYEEYQEALFASKVDAIANFLSSLGNNLRNVGNAYMGY